MTDLCDLITILNILLALSQTIRGTTGHPSLLHVIVRNYTTRKLYFDR